MKIALLGITHESNTFVKERTTLAHFQKGHWVRGAAIREQYEAAYHEIGGMIEAIDAAGMELVPVMYAEATPAGTITADTYTVLLHELMTELEAVLPIDACLVVPHGAGASEAFPDMDGHWLSVLRAKLGDSIPIIGTIDPHANVSQKMIDATNALISYKTNPHIDQRAVGKEAGNLLVQTLKGTIKPVQAFISLPLQISIEQQLSESDPCKSLLAYAKTINQEPNILSVSINLGFPYADVAEMGSSIIVVADNDLDLAQAKANALADYMLQNKELFNGQKHDINDILASIKQAEKPILLLDMGDNVGGGANGDSDYLLDALEKTDDFRSFICIYDPEAVKKAIKHAVEDIFPLRFGSNPQTHKKTERQVRLLKIADGQFEETTPRHGGQKHFDMGKIALIETAKGDIVMLTTLRVAPFSLRQLTAFGIEPDAFDVVIAKGVNAPIAAYKEVCKTIVQVNTPGITTADMTLFEYKNRRKPLFPFENIG